MRQRPSTDSVNVILLQFHTIKAEDGTAALMAEAIDEKTREPIACLGLPAMSHWLKAKGFGWRPGSNGIWERAA